MEHHHHPSILKPSSDDMKFCSVTLNPIKRIASSETDTHEIRVSLLFRQLQEIHQHCVYPESLCQEDHHTLWKESFNNVFAVDFVITDVLTTSKKDFPSYVSPGIFSYVTAKVSQYLQENINFDDDLLKFRFEMAAEVDVSTVIHL